MARALIVNKVYDKNDHGDLFVTTSGDPVFEVDYQDGNGFVALDLTVSPSYPLVILELPVCKYRITSGAASASSVSR